MVEISLYQQNGEVISFGEKYNLIRDSFKVKSDLFREEFNVKRKRFKRSLLVLAVGAGFMCLVGSNDAMDYSSQKPSRETQELRLEGKTYNINSDYFELG